VGVQVLSQQVFMGDVVIVEEKNHRASGGECAEILCRRNSRSVDTQAR